MKKLLLLIVFISAAFVWAQTEDFYVTENDEHASDTTADEIVLTEPIIVSTIVDSGVETVPDETPEQDMSASVEATISEYTKKINIPLWYRWKDFSFNALVPYFIEKKLDSMTDNSVSGLGDMTLGVGYGKYLDQYKTYIDFNLSTKLPTGQKDVEDDNGFKVDLTSETIDISTAVSGFYFMDDFTFKGTLLYKINGEYDTETEVWNSVTSEWETTKITTDVGDLFMFSAGADYRWQYNLTFGLNLLYGNHMSSETEGNDNENGLSFVDLTPMVKYPVSLFEFVAGAKIPVMTSAEAHDPDDDWSNQENRNPTFFFRTNYRIF